MTEYGYFTSYARADNSNTTLEKVVGDLREEVRTKLGLSPDESGKLGFFDQTDIATGDVWNEKLRSAVNEARVLVCLCSKTFFSRPHCAKEFEVFRRRIEAAAPEDPPVVVPVLWEYVKLPGALRRYQEIDARIPDKYRTVGLRKLRELGSHRDRYKVAIDVLAEVIAEKVRAAPPLATLDAPPSFDDLPGAFHNPGAKPLGFTAVVLHPDGETWRIDRFGDQIWLLFDRVAQNVGVSFRSVLTGPSLEAELGATGDDELVVVVTEQQRFEEAAWASFVKRVDAAAPAATWFVGVGRHEHAARGTAFVVAGGVTELASALTDALQAWLSRIPSTRASDTDAEERGQRRGVDITERPTVEGPSGEPL